MEKWVELPKANGMGPHVLRLPSGFNKTLDDYESVKEFLDAVRNRWKALQKVKSVN